MPKRTTEIGTLENVVENGKTVGFKFGVRLPRYRGNMVSLINGYYVSVDGEVFPQSPIRFQINGKAPRSFEELKKAVWEHWNYQDTAYLYIRPLAKLSQSVKVADTSNQGKAKSKALSPVTVTLGEDTKSFDKTDGVFDQDTFSGNLTVIFALLPGQGMIPGTLFRQEGIGV